MARANIDLSWLASLLTKTPTADSQANTPDDDIGSQGKFLDENFKDVDQPYQSPTAWQRMLHPEASGQIDQLNNQYSYKPIAAAQDNSIKFNTAKSNIARMPSSALPLGVTPDEMASTGYGTGQTPVELAQQNRAMSDMAGGITPIQSSTDINAAKENLTASNRALQRQPTVEAGLDQQSVNNLQKLLHVDEPSIRLAESQIKGELGREPTYEEVRERTLSNQLREQRDLVPLQANLALTQTGNAQDVATKTHELMPYTTGIMANDAVGKLAESRFQPLGEPFGNRVDGPMVTPGVRNPLSMAPFQQSMQLMKEYNGNNTQTITGPDGKPMTGPVPDISRKPYNPLDVPTTSTHNTDDMFNGAFNQRNTPPFNATPLSQTDNSSSLMDKNAFYKKLSSMPQAQKERATDALMEKLGNILNIPHEQIGSSVFNRNYANTVRNAISGPEYKDKLESISPEVADYLYHSALEE